MLHSLCICPDLVMYLPQSSFLLSPRGNTQQAKFGPGEGREKKKRGEKREKEEDGNDEEEGEDEEKRSEARRMGR